jgi:Protein of unknown function (DUF3140)
VAAAGQVSRELWGEFHTYVNMTSRELRDWLGVACAREDSEAVPEQDGEGPPAAASSPSWANAAPTSPRTTPA